MINGVGSTGQTRIGQVKDGKVGAPAPADAVTTTSNEKTMTPSLVAALAQSGPPINSDKIRAIRQAIASGQYPLDVKAIAAKMIALDLPKAIA